MQFFFMKSYNILYEKYQLHVENLFIIIINIVLEFLPLCMNRSTTAIVSKSTLELIGCSEEKEEEFPSVNFRFVGA